MRLIHTWDQEDEALTCAAYLQGAGIDCHVEQSSGGNWELWGHDERERKQAIVMFEQFMQNPQQYAQTTASVELLKQNARERQVEMEEAVRKNTVQLGAEITPYLTFSMIGISIIFAVMTNLGENFANTIHFTFVEFVTRDGNWYANDNAIMEGQVWRLLTPTFLHFGILHIVFNCLWVSDLGSIIERRFGWKYLLAMLLVIGIGANVGQYYIGGVLMEGANSSDGRLFGGLSGLVYGLLSFLWIRGRMLPHQGLVLNQQVVFFMLIWYVLCFTGAFGNIANTAHSVGLFGGALWGYLSAMRARARGQ